VQLTLELQLRAAVLLQPLMRQQVASQQQQRQQGAHHQAYADPVLLSAACNELLTAQLATCASSPQGSSILQQVLQQSGQFLLHALAAPLQLDVFGLMSKLWPATPISLGWSGAGDQLAAVIGACHAAVVPRDADGGSSSSSSDDDGFSTLTGECLDVNSSFALID
jgi:ABC-type Fe3+ transport system permease subunit